MAFFLGGYSPHHAQTIREHSQALMAHDVNFHGRRIGPGGVQSFEKNQLTHSVEHCSGRCFYKDHTKISYVYIDVMFIFWKYMF